MTTITISSNKSGRQILPCRNNCKANMANSHIDSVIELGLIEQSSGFVTRCISSSSGSNEQDTALSGAASRMPEDGSNHSSDGHQSIATKMQQQQQQHGSYEIITPTSLRSITLAGLYHSSRRSRHISPQRTGAVSGGSNIITPLPLVSGADGHEWKEMENAISCTAKEEWSFNISRQASFSSMEDFDDDMICEAFDEDDD